MSTGRICFTKSVEAARRTYTFDVRQAPTGELCFTISELSNDGSLWHRSRVRVEFGEAREFYLGLCEAIRAMREAERGDSDSATAGARPVRATGRVSQGANRQALLAGVR